MERSNMFANIENIFKFAEKEEIISTALSSLGELLNAIDHMDDQVKFGIMLVGAQLGVAGDGVLNSQEKELIDEVFGRIWNGSMSEIYDMVGVDIQESDYDMVQNVIQLGNPVAMPFLYYILSFAYIDGEIEDDVAERLDGLFGMNLLIDFMQSGAEEVTSSQICLTDLEAEIVSWFREDDTLHSLKEIQAHFSSKSKIEVQKALDNLVDRGILYGGANIAGNMYALA